MADVITGDTQTDILKQTLVANIVQRQLIAKGVIAPTVRDVSSFAVDGMDEIDFPRMSNLPVTKKVSGTPVDAAAITWSSDKLLLDQHAVIQWLIEKKASKQSSVNLEQASILNAAAGHAKQVDVDLHAAMVAGVSASGPDHIIAFAGASFGRADVVKGLELLDMQEMPEEQRYMLVHPTEYATLLNITDFVDANRYGSTQAIMNGELGSLFGMKVIKSTVCTAGRPFIYQSEGVVLGFQMAPSFDQDKDLPNVATRYSIDQLYGVKTMQGGKGLVRLGAAT